MGLTNILSSAAIILGIYLVFAHIIMRENSLAPAETYHLGCFLTHERVHNQSLEIEK